MKHRNLLLALAAIALGFAALFRFAVIGYGVTALLCVGAAAVLVLYALLPKRFKIMLTILLCIGAVLFTAAEVQVLRASHGEPEAQADYLIVLGAGVNGTVPSLSMLNRLHAALDYLNAHPGCTAVVTGGMGRGEQISEAEAMAVWLEAQGIAPERILWEPEATSTLENLRFSLALIPDREQKRIAVCSSEYHLCRAEYMGRSLGAELLGVPARTTLPVLRFNYFVREGIGMWYLWLFGV